MAQRSTLCDRIIAPSFVHKSTQRSADRPEDKGGRRAAVVDPVGNSAMLFSFQRGCGGEFAVFPRYFLQKILLYPSEKSCVIFHLSTVVMYMCWFIFEAILDQINDFVPKPDFETHFGN